jgi:hypothetical protein
MKVVIWEGDGFGKRIVVKRVLSQRSTPTSFGRAPIWKYDKMPLGNVARPVSRIQSQSARTTTTF